jgi:fused signal recognition particle receptor
MLNWFKKSSAEATPNAAPAASTPVADPALPPPSAAAPVGQAGDASGQESTRWFARLRRGLAKSAGRLAHGLVDIVARRKLDDEALEALEETLIAADLGPAVAARLAQGLRRSRFGREVTDAELKAYLAQEIETILQPVAQPLRIDPTVKPWVILMVGVNGSGKTTTIGKLAQQWRQEGLSVWLAAGDTFRAAATAQLQIWGERTGCPVIAKHEGADAAAVAYEAVEKARAGGADILLIDTAGRLQNKAGLMDELSKITRVIKKAMPDAPHATILTLDAVTGQNAVVQAEIFQHIAQVNALILTKLDGSARGGVMVALAEKFGLPVAAVGVGESADDLRPFSARDFARSLVGLSEDEPSLEH